MQRPSLRSLLVFTTTLAIFTYSAQSSSMSLKLIDDGNVFFATLSGTIFPSTPGAAKPALTRAVLQKPVAVFIQSGGGAFVAIKPMATMLLDLAKKHYDVHHKPLMMIFQFTCSSGCTILSAMLTKLHDAKTMTIRTSDDTDFSFHGSVIHNNGRVDKSATRVAKNELEKQIVKTYLDNGVSADFINANKEMFTVHFKQKTFPGHELCEKKTMVIPPDACLHNQLDIYRWVARQTSSEEELKLLIPPEKKDLPIEKGEDNEAPFIE